MSRYHVTYFHLETGRCGSVHACEDDYGYVAASSKEEAAELAAIRQHPMMPRGDLEQVKGRLTATATK